MQSQFVLDAMAEGYAKTDAKLDKLMESVDLLFSKMEDLTITQQQMQVKLDINSKAVDLSMREQQLMAQQLEAIGQAVAKLTLEHMGKTIQNKGEVLHHRLQLTTVRITIDKTMQSLVSPKILVLLLVVAMLGTILLGIRAPCRRCNSLGLKDKTPQSGVTSVKHTFRFFISLTI